MLRDYRWDADGICHTYPLGLGALGSLENRVDGGKLGVRKVMFRALKLSLDTKYLSLKRDHGASPDTLF